jgi:hypothetical protein
MYYVFLTEREMSTLQLCILLQGPDQHSIILNAIFYKLTISPGMSQEFALFLAETRSSDCVSFHTVSSKKVKGNISLCLTN